MIVYRDTKGTNLDAAEIDENFRDLDSRTAALEYDPPEAISIDHFTVEGTLLTIHMSNGSSHGPFVLPTAQWRWTGEWQAGVTYLPGDIFSESGNVYFVRVMHVSVSPFDPALFTVDGFVYIKILSKAAQPYDLAMFFIDLIGSGTDVLFMHVVARDLQFYPVFANSKAFLRVATSTSIISIPIYRSTALASVVIGLIVFTPGELTTADGGQFGEFEVNDEYLPLTLAAGERLSIAQPYEDDDTAAGLAVTFATLTAAS